MKRLFLILFIGVSAIMILSAEGNQDGPTVSTFAASTHSAGKSCKKCHGNLQICGTIYNAEQSHIVSNVMVKFSTTKDSTGIIKAKLEVDKSGNFYTNDKFDFKGLFPLVVNADGTNAQYMKSSINSGDCNSCHGNAKRIWIK